MYSIREFIIFCNKMLLLCNDFVHFIHANNPLLLHYYDNEDDDEDDDETPLIDIWKN